jgi:tRNA-modifying protein YgfZ
VTGYGALRESAAWFELPARGKIRVTGEDSARLLHAMTTNNVRDLAPGQGCYAFFLNAQGRVLADAHVLRVADEFLLDTEPETAAKVRDHLDQYIIADDVTIEDRTAELTTMAIEGPASADVLARAGLPAPAAACGVVAWNSALVVRMSYAALAGFFVIVPVADRDAMVAALEAAGAVPADADAVHVVRIENVKPRYGEDIGERFLAQETSQMNALHFSKGCYLGQEIVERVRSRGQLHRRLLPVELNTSVVPATGTKLAAAGREAAEITSAAFSPARGKVVALAYVRMDVKPGGAIASGELSGIVLAGRA